jgi:Uma2 family endonuclease
MSSVVHPVVSWEAFQELPEPSNTGNHYELHDGEVVEVPPPDVRHILVQMRIEDLLRLALGTRGFVKSEFPYRPAANIQYWVADVAFVPRDDLDSFPRQGALPIYAPPLIIEVLSPSNRLAKLNHQRLVALSGGTREFWVVDPEKNTVLVTDLSTATVNTAGQTIPATPYHAAIAVDEIFTV